VQITGNRTLGNQHNWLEPNGRKQMCEMWCRYPDQGAVQGYLMKITDYSMVIL
jgi:hypothetical protein